MKKTIINTWLPILFVAFTTIGFTSCSGDDDSFIPYINSDYETSELEQYYFKINSAKYIDNFMPDGNTDLPLTSVNPKDINLQAGESVTIEIASDIELDKFHIGAEDIQSTGLVIGYYEVTAKKTNAVAGLNIYEITLKFPKTAKTEFLITIYGVKNINENYAEITKASRISVYLEPVITETTIIGKWEHTDALANTTTYYEFKKDGSGYIYDNNGTTGFTYTYSLATGKLRIKTTSDEIISCTIWFSANKNSIKVIEDYRYTPTTGTTETGIEYILTRILK